MTAESDGARYIRVEPLLRSGLEDLRLKLETGLSSAIGEFVLIGRVKTARSLIRKMRGSTPPRSWDSVTDKVGLRLICSTLDDVRAADRWVQASWLNVVEREVKTGKHNRLFYPGLHFLVSDDEILDDLGQPLLFELQIRTRAQDAWAVVSHKLLYKGLLKPPRRVKRVVNRLTVVVEMFDDEVRRMFKRRASQPEFRMAMMLEDLDERFAVLTGEPSASTPNLDLFQVLLPAYEAFDVDEFKVAIDHYLDGQGTGFRDLLVAHYPSARGYDDNKDWLFSQPEIIAIVERATTKPFLLLEAIQGTDLEQSVRRACVEAGVPLPEV